MDLNLSHHFIKEHPREAARTLETFESELLAQYLAQLPVESAASVLKYIVPSIASSCIEQMAGDSAVGILMHLDLERAALLLRRIEEGKREHLIKAASSDFAGVIRQVLRYPEGTVGQVMDPRIFTVHEDMRVDEVINTVRKAGGLLQHEIYIINDRQQPSGLVAVRQLLTSGESETMKNIMQPLGETLAARTSLASIKHSGHWDHRDSIPAVDHQGRFIGVLHRRSLNLTAVEDEPEQDYAGTALTVAELFWDVCVNMLHPLHENETKGPHHERSD